MIESHPPSYFIVLLRHGESVGNAEGYHQGQSEFPLTEKGRKQVQALAHHWKKNGRSFDKVIASPQTRARQTAEILTDQLGLEIEFDKLWMERDNGVYAGLHQDEARVKYPYPDFIHIYTPIGKKGESQWELYLRGGRAIQSILHHPPGDFLIVSHGGILNMTLHAILGIPPQANFQGPRFRFRNTAFATLTYYPENHNWNIEGINHHPHLVDR